MKTSPAQTAAASSTAVLRRRLIAVGIDAVGLLVVWFVLRRLLGGGTTTFAVMVVLVVAVLAIVQGETGTTPGKAVMQLRLVNDLGRPPGAVVALVRLAASVVDYLPCLPLVGPLLIWFSPTHQRIGDTITRTYVVAKEGTEEPAATAHTAAEATPSGPAPAPYRGEEERTDFNPIWDAKVNAYVQWDPNGKRWMRFDDAVNDWAPVDVT